MAELDGPADHFDVLHRMASTGPLAMLTKQRLRSAARFFPAMVTLLVLDTPPGPKASVTSRSGTYSMASTSALALASWFWASDAGCSSRRSL
jgi:hypothetical protein